MEIKCPKCASRFNLPDSLAMPGAKLRCSICSTVFQLPDKDAPAKDSSSRAGKNGALPEMKAPKKSGRKLLWLCLCIFLLAAGGAGFYFYNKYPEKLPLEEETAKKVEMLTMRNVRQYNVLNEKVGKVFVIEGKVVNEFPSPKELIELEGAIYDENKTPVREKKQLAGTQLSLFQLQVLSEKEMESFLNNKVEILANNTNIPPGGEVPFMILFYDPPENISEFGVKIIDAKDASNNL